MTSIRYSVVTKRTLIRATAITIHESKMAVGEIPEKSDVERGAGATGFT